MKKLVTGFCLVAILASLSQIVIKPCNEDPGTVGSIPVIQQMLV